MPRVVEQVDLLAALAVALVAAAREAASAGVDTLAAVAAAISVAAAGDDSGIRQEKSPRD